MPVIDKQFHSARTSECVRGGTTEIRCIASERANACEVARRVGLVRKKASGVGGPGERSDAGDRKAVSGRPNERMRARWHDGNPLHSVRTSECPRDGTTGGPSLKRGDGVGPASEAMPAAKPRPSCLCCRRSGSGGRLPSQRRQIRHRVGDLCVDPKLEVQVWSGRHPARALEADSLSPSDMVSDPHVGFE